jgi:hypothetical protein
MLREDVRSLRELHLLLEPDARSLPGVNLQALAHWIRRVLDDEDFALATAQVVERSESYAEACALLWELVGHRLDQAQIVERAITSAAPDSAKAHGSEVREVLK